MNTAEIYFAIRPKSIMFKYAEFYESITPLKFLSIDFQKDAVE